jgi:hypothetical protein
MGLCYIVTRYPIACYTTHSFYEIHLNVKRLRVFGAVNLYPERYPEELLLTPCTMQSRKPCRATGTVATLNNRAKWFGIDSALYRLMHPNAFIRTANPLLW